jgi:hypothetical protein
VKNREKQDYRYGEEKMKRLLSVVLLIVFLPLLAIAQSDFNGTWKVDLTKSTMPDKADVFLLQNGTYQCKTCVPPINVKADGEDHGIAGNPYYNAVAVQSTGQASTQAVSLVPMQGSAMT